jgi:hypothetical protein
MNKETITLPNGEIKEIKQPCVNGNYHNICVYCKGYMINAHKRCNVCMECASKRRLCE